VILRRAAAALALALVVIVGAAGAAAAKETLPAFSAPVVDQTGLVPEGVKQQIDAGLTDYQSRTGNQIAVAVVKTTGDTALEEYSIDLARAWGVGQKGKDNGVVLLIAYDDHKVRIEVGRGLEGQLTDLQSGRIIQERLLPLLRQGDVAGAVQQGTDAIRQDLGDPNVGPLPAPPAPAPVSTGSGRSAISVLFPILLLGFIAFSSIGGNRRRRRGLFGFPIFWGGGFGGGGFGGGGFGGGGGGGGFGGGGGGFGGGGGGGFGGGGASGSW
jgi:uncharacterized protein